MIFFISYCNFDYKFDLLIIAVFITEKIRVSFCQWNNEVITDVFGFSPIFLYKKHGMYVNLQSNKSYLSKKLTFTVWKSYGFQSIRFYLKKISCLGSSLVHIFSNRKKNKCVSHGLIANENDRFLGTFLGRKFSKQLIRVILLKLYAIFFISFCVKLTQLHYMIVCAMIRHVFGCPVGFCWVLCCFIVWVGGLSHDMCNRLTNKWQHVNRRAPFVAYKKNVLCELAVAWVDYDKMCVVWIGGRPQLHITKCVFFESAGYLEQTCSEFCIRPHILSKIGF